MAVLAATFLLVLALVAGSHWWLVLRPERRVRERVRRRLADRPAVVEPSLARRTDALSAIPALDRLLRQRVRLSEPLQRLLTEADVPVSLGAVLLASAGLAAAGVGAGWAGPRLLVVGLTLATIGGALPWIWIVRRRALRMSRIDAQFPEAMDLIARALRAGHAFSAALAIVGDELPAPLGVEFRRLHDEHTFGASLEAALDRLAARVPLVDMRFFVTAVRTQRETGGNLSEVLDRLARIIRDRFTLQRQIRVISAHGRLSAWVLACLPPVLAGVLFLMSPRFMRILLEDPLGLRLMTAAVGLELLGTVIIVRLVRMEY